MHNLWKTGVFDVHWLWSERHNMLCYARLRVSPTKKKFVAFFRAEVEQVDENAGFFRPQLGVTAFLTPPEPKTRFTALTQHVVCRDHKN